jgi:hypothetical protein
MPLPDLPVFTGQGSALTRAGVWRAVKGLMAVVGLDPHDATHLYRASGADPEIVRSSSAMPALGLRRSTPRFPRRTRPGLWTPWRSPTGTRNGTGELVRVGRGRDMQSPVFHSESPRKAATVYPIVQIAHPRDP